MTISPLYKNQPFEEILVLHPNIEQIKEDLLSKSILSIANKYHISEYHVKRIRDHFDIKAPEMLLMIVEHPEHGRKEITNYTRTQFIKEHKIASAHFHMMLTGRAKSAKQWRRIS